MSWAAKRQTTRPEDLAYCLLGLFDVQMPLLYEEGGQKAFYRLQEEIMKNSMDHSLLAWSSKNLALPQNLEVGLRGWLAIHPSEFMEAGSIDLLPHYHHDDSVTERGVSLRLEVVDRGERPDGSKLSWAILRCHEESNLTGPLAIPLIQLNRQGDKVYARETSYSPIVLSQQYLEKKKRETYESWELQKFKKIAECRILDALFITPVYTLVFFFVCKNLYRAYNFLSLAFARTRKPSSLLRTVFIPKNPRHENLDCETFQFLFHPDEYVATDAFPSENWNSFENVFNFRDADINNRAGIVIMRSIRHNLCIAIMVGMLNADSEKPDTFLLMRYLSSNELETRNSLEWWIKKLDVIKSAKLRNTSAQLKLEKMFVEASLKKRFIMGKPIFEVRIEESFLTILKDWVGVVLSGSTLIGACLLMVVLMELFWPPVSQEMDNYAKIRQTFVNGTGFVKNLSDQMISSLCGSRDIPGLN